MRAPEDLERLLEITIVGQSAAMAGQQRLVAGMGDGGLLEHGDGLGALPGGAKRLAVAQGGVGILGVAAIALAIDFKRAARVSVGVGAGFGLRRGDLCSDVGHGLAAAEPRAQYRGHGCGGKEPGKTGLLTHGTLTHHSRRID